MENQFNETLWRQKIEQLIKENGWHIHPKRDMDMFFKLVQAKNGRCPCAPKTRTCPCDEIHDDMQERNTCKCTFIVNDAYLEQWGYEIDIEKTTPESSTQLDQIERQLEECIKEIGLIQTHIIEISNRITFLKQQSEKM